jgi:hypothetical protein
MITQFYIKARAVISRTTAKLMKTGQTTSYRTGDDGNIQAGRATSFSVLAENNPFGNTNRFTDELGGQTYTNNIMIDWSTFDGSSVLGWARNTYNNNADWNTVIDAALAYSVGTFTTGWRLPNVNELLSIYNYSLGTKTNYSPLNITAGINAWTSTTVASSTTQAYFSNPVSTNAILNALTKTTLRPIHIFCRTFTVTGTTLT